jgi:hypothetical protein
MRFLRVLLLFLCTSVKADVVLINDIRIHQKQLYRYEVQSIFMLRNIYWHSGLPIIPIFLDFDSDIHKKFVSTVLRISPTHFDVYIRDKVQKGDGARYVIADNIPEAIQYVKRTPGAIAYIPQDVLYTIPGVQVIKVVE